MKQEGSLEVFRYVLFVLVVVVLKVFACLLLVAMLLTATSLIDPLVTVLSLPKLAIALVAISEIFFIVSFWFFSVFGFFLVPVLMFGYECLIQGNLNLAWFIYKCEREEKKNEEYLFLVWFLFLIFVYNLFFSLH